MAMPPFLNKGKGAKPGDKAKDGKPAKGGKGGMAPPFAKGKMPAKGSKGGKGC